jgi:tryptophan-rich sensory protein
MSSRFDTCVRPPWQPPNYVFQYVWPVLYVLYLYTLLTQWNNTQLRDILIIGLVLNISWVPVFQRNPTFALAILTVMVWLALRTSVALKTRVSLLLFTPYTAWIIFAWTLNAYIAWNC